MHSVDEPRHRPYKTKPGESQFYAADGHGSTLYHRRHQDGADGLYMCVNDDQQGDGRNIDGSRGGQQQKRYVSVRHVNKKRQERKGKKNQGQGGGSSRDGRPLYSLTRDELITELVALDYDVDSTLIALGHAPRNGGSGGGGQQQDYKHEGDSVNVETRHLATAIQFYDGSSESGHYNRGNKDWIYHSGSAEKSMRSDEKHSHIKNDGAHVWVQKGVCYKSVPFVIKPDSCK